MSDWLARTGVVLLVLVLYTGSQAARELTPEFRELRRRGQRVSLTGVRRHHFRSERGWHYWQWTRRLLVAWTGCVLLWALTWWARVTST